MAEKENLEFTEEVVEDKQQETAVEDKEEKVVDLETDEVEIEEPVKELSELEKLTQENENYKNTLLRMQADFENFRKRNNELSAKMYKNGMSEAVMTIFPVLDSLDLALNMYKNEQDKAGIELITKQFMTALGTLGVKEIEANGKEFDPKVHEAVAKEDSDEHESNQIIEVLRKGYTLNDKVLRPTMVKVAN